MKYIDPRTTEYFSGTQVGPETKKNPFVRFGRGEIYRRPKSEKVDGEEGWLMIVGGPYVPSEVPDLIVPGKNSQTFWTKKIIQKADLHAFTETQKSKFENGLSHHTSFSIF